MSSGIAFLIDWAMERIHQVLGVLLARAYPFIFSLPPMVRAAKHDASVAFPLGRIESGLCAPGPLSTSEMARLDRLLLLLSSFQASHPTDGPAVRRPTLQGRAIQRQRLSLQVHQQRGSVLSIL